MNKAASRRNKAGCLFPWHLVKLGSMSFFLARIVSRIIPRAIWKKAHSRLYTRIAKEGSFIFRPSMIKLLRFIDISCDMTNSPTSETHLPNTIHASKGLEGRKILVVVGENVNEKVLDSVMDDKNLYYILPTSDMKNKLDKIKNKENCCLLHNSISNIAEDENDFSISRQAAIQLSNEISTIIEDFDPIISRIRLPVENMLTIRIGYNIRIFNIIKRSCAEHDIDEVVFLVGSKTLSHMADALRQTGLVDKVHVVFAARRLADQAGHFMAMTHNPLPPTGQQPPSPARQRQTVLALMEEVNRLARGAVRKPPFKRMRGAPVICADFRNAADFRHLPTALRVLENLRARGQRPFVMQYRTILSKNTISNLHRISSRYGLGYNVLLVKSPNAHGPREASYRFFAEFPSLRERIHALAAEPAYHTVITGAACEFISEQLHGILALAKGMHRMLRKHPPSAMAFFPGSSPVAMITTAVAGGLRIPTLCVFTLLVGNSSRDCITTCSHLAVMDSWQRDLLARRWGIPQERFFLIGNNNVYALQQEMKRLGTDKRTPDGRKKVVYVSQPIGSGSVEGLKWCLQALSHRRDVEFRMHAHPNESEHMLNIYRSLIADAGKEDFWFAGKGTPLSVLAEADLVITISSNLGMHAGIAGKPVITLPLFGGELSVDFERMGLAVRAKDPADLKQLMDDFLDGGPRLKALSERQQRYREDNPEMARGDVAELLTQAILTLAEQGSSPGRTSQR